MHICAPVYNIHVILSQECDLGQQSILHAVRTPNKMLNKKKDTTSPIEESISETSNLDDSGSKPMNETLMDLSLDESDQQNLSLEGDNNVNLNYQF